jgi:hypothetical protein
MLVQDARRIGEAFLALVRTLLLGPRCRICCPIALQQSRCHDSPATLLTHVCELPPGKVREPELPGLPQGREEARQAAAARALPAVLHARAAQPAMGPGWVFFTAQLKDPPAARAPSTPSDTP